MLFGISGVSFYNSFKLNNVFMGGREGEDEWILGTVVAGRCGIGRVICEEWEGKYGKQICVFNGGSEKRVRKQGCTEGGRGAGVAEWNF